jgi:DNA-binding response OmpR family regulator
MPGKVLVVDDDVAIRKMVSAVLKREQLAVDVAADGEQALNLIAERQYDVIVLDLMMSAISGTEVLTRLHATPTGTKCVVIMSAGSEAVLDGLDSNLIQAKLRKPFDLSELVQAVHACVAGTDSMVPATRNYPRRKPHPSS